MKRRPAGAMLNPSLQEDAQRPYDWRRSDAAPDRLAIDPYAATARFPNRTAPGKKRKFAALGTNVGSGP